MLDRSVEFARELAETWDQFAIYEVTKDHVVVRSVDTGEILT